MFRHNIIVVLLFTIGVALAQRSREERNLRTAFPFRQQDIQEENRVSHLDHSGREAKQRRGGGGRGGGGRGGNRGGGGNRGSDGPGVELDIGSIAAAGERCIDKVVMVEETEYDDVVTCKHSYSEKCHTTYITDFEPQQEEECEENFIKNCFIEFRKAASDEKVTICHTPIELVGGGPETCQTVYESDCRTRYEQHDVDEDQVKCETIQEEKCVDETQGYTTEEKCTKWPVKRCFSERSNIKKYSPVTECKKVPRTICGPGNEQVPGAEECFDRTETAIIEIPSETCNLEPQRICKHVTKLVPHLKPSEECVDIPTEACSRSRTNPRKVQKPVVKKWCYVPTAQSGLA